MSNVPTEADITAALRERIARAECLLQLAGIVRETARKMEGKQVNKRFYTAAKARIQQIMGASYGAAWEDGTFGWKLVVWNGSHDAPAWAPKWNDRVSFNIGRAAHPALRNASETVSETWIVAENQGYFLEAERLPKLRAALDNGKAREWADKARVIADMRRALGEDMEACAASYIVKMP